MSKYLCPCYKVTKEDVLKAIEDGADSFKEIKKATKAAEGCGHCECKVKKFAKKQLKEKEQDSADNKKKSKKKEKSKH